jgi:hypothetical protein
MQKDLISFSKQRFQRLSKNQMKLKTLGEDYSGFSFNFMKAFYERFLRKDF